MNVIRLDFKNLPHPYPEEPSSDLETWGIIKLSVADENNSVIFHAFEIEWDVNVLVNWVKENEHYLRTERLPLPRKDSESIAQILFEFYENVDPGADAILDRIFGYRRRHGLRFAFRGVDLKEIYIGKGVRGYEISHYDGIDNWCYYDLEIGEFVASVKNLRKGEI